MQRFDAHVFDQFFSFHCLQMDRFDAVRAPGPAEVGDFVDRTDVFFRRAMTIETEAHAEGFDVADLIHLIDAAVAFDATDAAGDVDGMVEIDVIGGDMDLDPGDRDIIAGALADDGQARVVFEHLVMAIHAGGSAGQVGIPGFIDAVMTVPAIETQLAGMDGVGKRHRLRRLIAFACVFGGDVKSDGGRHYPPDQREDDDDP